MNMKRCIDKLVVSLLSILLAVIIGSVVIVVCGYSPWDAYKALIQGAFGTLDACMSTFEKSVPLIFCGLAAMVGFKSGMFNIGIEGQLIMGAIVYALAGVEFGFLPLPVHVMVCSLLAMTAGALWASLAALLKVFRNANEVVSTVMLNYIAIYFTEYLVSGPFMAAGTIAQSEALDPSRIIPFITDHIKLTWTCVFACVFVVMAAFFYRYTVAGFNMMAAGENPKAAEAGGIRMNQARVMSMAISGSLAGLAGAMLVASTYGRFVLNMSAGYGFDGMAISVLGQNTAVGVFLSSILFGGLRTGSLYMTMFENIPSEIVSILQGLIILTISAPLLIQYLRRRKNR